MKPNMHFLGHMPLLCELTLIIALAGVVSSWFLPVSNGLQPVGLLQNMSPTDVTLPKLAGLLAVPLFGKIAPQTRSPKPVAQKPRPLMPSRLNIKLLGTVVAGKNSAAIIAIAKNPSQQVFFIGDRIQPGVILKEVATDAIVLERDGKLERISLEQGAKLTGSPPLQKAAITASPEMDPSQATSRKMNRVRLQQQLQNFPALMSQARAMPHFVNGKPNGFAISEIAPGSLYQKAGLQNGDIILSVNGKQITGIKQAMNMYQTLKSAPSIDLELIRSGQIRKIHYDIR